MFHVTMVLLETLATTEHTLGPVDVTESPASTPTGAMTSMDLSALHGARARMQLGQFPALTKSASANAATSTGPLIISPMPTAGLPGTVLPHYPVYQTMYVVDM